MNDGFTPVEAIYTALRRRCIAMARSRGVSQETAEDIAQTAFVKLIEHIQEMRMDNPAEVRAWLNRVVFNLCMDIHRRKKPTDSIDDSIAAQHALVTHHSPERLAIADQELRDAYRTLTTDQREVLMWVASGYDTDEIAKGLGITDAAVHSRTFQGRKRLRA